MAVKCAVCGKDSELNPQLHFIRALESSNRVVVVCEQELSSPFWKKAHGDWLKIKKHAKKEQ